MPGQIEDYAMIGDMRTAALVGRDGSIDWFCAPRFDSAACFAALLGKRENGRWKIGPRHAAEVHRQYQDGGLILETRFENEDGKVSIVDFMPVDEAHTSIVRLVIGREGKMAMETDLVIRFDYGLSMPWVNRMDKNTWTAVAGPSMLVLRTPVTLCGQDMHTVGRFTVKKGQTIPFVLTYVLSHLDRRRRRPISKHCTSARRAFWRDWSRRCRIPGRWSGHVCRSLITLKGLSFRPTGGIVAAPTTSLPEKIGGPRNWDYRFCWLRDAAFTLLAFLNAGYTEEADAWQRWLLRAVAGSPQQLQIMYGVAGERDLGNGNSTGSPGTKARVRCAWAMPPPARCSSTSTANSPTCWSMPRAADSPWLPDARNCASPSWIISKRSGAFPTKASGKFAENRGISSIPR